MQVSDIGIYTGEVEFTYKPIRRLEAKVEATTVFQSAPNMDDANSKLRELAMKVGANAIVNVEYNSGVSMTSWRSMKATGLAVIKDSDEVNCSQCAETIKRAAKVCRFCGHEQVSEQQAPAVSSVESLAISSASNNSDHLATEPLRGTNNPQLWIFVAGGLFLLLILLGSVS